MIFKRLKKKPTNGAERPTEAGPTIIASDVVIDGNITATGELQIDGTVHGSVRARSCVIDMQGVVEGEVTAEEVYVRGRIIGPIRGVHVHLHAGAHVEGDVINETISVENGAYIYGTIRRSEDPLAQPAAAPGFTALANPANRSGDQGYSVFDQDIGRPVKSLRPR
jgi:cytoskeletal protein CcmA (bactofilin family)